MTSVSYRVASAAGSASLSTAQKRERLARTYHCDTSSTTNSMSARAPSVGSYCAHEDPTAVTVASSRLSSQRSTSGRSAGGGAVPGVQSPA